MSKSKYRIRTVRTASGATAVQVIWYENNTRKVAKHIGSATHPDEIEILHSSAKRYIAENEPQLSLFQEPISQVVLFDQIEITSLSHQFARTILLSIAKQCGLGALDRLYLDLAIMRIIEPCSKLRSIELIKQYFHVSYSQYVYECLPKLLKKRELIESAAIKTAKSFESPFSLLLYDVTTLYFETHKADDDLQARGFSKDDKSKQPQIVIGLLVTQQGFPLLQETFKGNTFEGHTMLSIIKKFQTTYSTEKPIIVADAAMLSQENMKNLEKEGYQYIVGARLSNTKAIFLETLSKQLSKRDGATIRIAYLHEDYDIICSYSEARYKKDLREMQKQIEKAKTLIARKEAGRRAKFVKKEKATYLFDEALKQKTELLLGVKGYCTNIPQHLCSDENIILHYHRLWRVEQVFRMSKNDLRTRPIFHHTHDAIKAHVLICFIALMLGKYIEIKTGYSLRRVRDLIWQVQEAHLRDPQSGRERVVLTPLSEELTQILNFLNIKIPH
jgi:transposase